MSVFVSVSLLAAPPWTSGPGGPGGPGQAVHTVLRPGPLPWVPSSFPGSAKGTEHLPVQGWHARLSQREAGTMELIKPTWTQGPGTQGLPSPTPCNQSYAELE